MKFGQQVRWLDGNNWHMGTLVANYGNNSWGVTHVMNPTQATKPEFTVRNVGGTLKTFHEKMTQADLAYTNPAMQNSGRYQPTRVPQRDSMPLGAMIYQEQYKKMKSN